MAAPAIPRCRSVSAWLSLGFCCTSTTGPAKRAKEPPRHEIDPATHYSTYDDTADTIQSLDPNFSLDPHEILTTTRLKFSNHPASTRSTLHAASSSVYASSGNRHSIPTTRYFYVATI